MKKFAASGQLRKTIEARRKHQKVQKKLQKRRGRKNDGVTVPEQDEEDEEPQKYAQIRQDSCN